MRRVLILSLFALDASCKVLQSRILSRQSQPRPYQCLRLRGGKDGELDGIEPDQKPNSVLTKMFGDTLLNGTQPVATEQALQGKERVAIYFSAHWCPPCRGFTPMLAEQYKKLVAEGKSFEIVFASSDQSADEFKEYHAEMPWLALPFEQKDLKNKLSKQFKVQGIPTLVILDGEGQTVTTDGRSAVMEEEYPWTPKTFAEVMEGTEFLKGEGDSVKYGDLEGKILALYFSAHWCPPCRAFTPQLVETYEKLQEQGKPFEIIFASSDRDTKEFREYFAEMPWLAIPQGDARKAELSKLFGVQGLPTLVVLDERRGVITTKGRGAVGADPDGEEFPWHPKPVPDLSEGPDGLNEETCLVVLCEGATADAKAAITRVLEPIALQSKADAKLRGEGQPFLFFTGKEEGDIAGQIRELCKLPAPAEQPTVLLLDIPDDGGFYVSGATEVTEASVKDFLRQYTDKALTRQQLS